MPIYEYECRSCNKRHEAFQRHDDMPLTVCPDCGGEMKKLISNTSFVLKGTGWYKTDYAEKGRKKSSETDKGNGAKSGEKAESTPEKKPEAVAKT